MKRHVFLLLLALGWGAARPVLGAGRTIAVLEHRANVTGELRVSASMAAELAQLTSHLVITPAEARRRFGTAFDGKVARCAGEPRCIAALGKNIQCDEVVLVGLSQLGHMIVAIQRINVRSGQVLAQVADSFKPTSHVDSATLVGYLRRLFPPDDFKRYGQIIMRTADRGDEVYLDGALQGRAPVPPLKVAAPARHTVIVKRPGHVPFVASVDVLPDAALEVMPTLARRHRWYQQWWIWAVAGGVAAGAAAAVAVVGLSRRHDTIPVYVQPQQP